MSDTPKALKRAMRKEMRSTISDSLKHEDKRELCARRFTNTEEFRRAHMLLIFLSTDQEIPTTGIIHTAWNAGMRVAVPRITGDILVFKELSVGEMPVERDRFGILQPSENAPSVTPVSLADTDVLVAVPGLAFDLSGNRLGKGKGFYDRFLTALLKENPDSALVALCLECQIVDRVPTADFDIPVHALCTEKRMIHIKA